MTIRYQCEECGSVLNIRDEKAGTQGRCPKCKAEFVVPNPEKTPPEETAARVAEAKALGLDDSVRGATPTAGAGGDLSEEEIEQFLETNDPAPAGGYGVAEVDEADDELDEDDDDLDEDDVDEPPVLKMKGRSQRASRKGRGKGSRKGEAGREPAAGIEPAETVAGIAKSLMARGGDKKADKGSVVERDPRKPSRPFGGDDRGDDDEGRFSVKEITAYFVKYAGPAVVGLSLGIGWYIYWYMGWQKGTIPDLAPVSGTVKLDGQPLAQAQVLFIPVLESGAKPNLQLGPSVAFTDPKGRYTLVYKAPVTGAVIGKHLVQISATNKEGHELIPPSYGARSKKIVEVKPGGNNAEDFDIPSKPPEDSAGSVGGISTTPGQ